jgi:hypothetical protein
MRDERDSFTIVRPIVLQQLRLIAPQELAGLSIDEVQSGTCRSVATLQATIARRAVLSDGYGDRSIEAEFQHWVDDDEDAPETAPAGAVPC